MIEFHDFLYRLHRVILIQGFPEKRADLIQYSFQKRIYTMYPGSTGQGLK